MREISLSLTLLPNLSFFSIVVVVTASVPTSSSRGWTGAPEDVERELLRLHQYRKLSYESAGSLGQLTLPFPTALAYAEAC